jgi:hypothetical protein
MSMDSQETPSIRAVTASKARLLHVYYITMKTKLPQVIFNEKFAMLSGRWRSRSN